MIVEESAVYPAGRVISAVECGEDIPRNPLGRFAAHLEILGDGSADPHLPFVR